jgi:hypothetical protein
LVQGAYTSIPATETIEMIIADTNEKITDGTLQTAAPRKNAFTAIAKTDGSQRQHGFAIDSLGRHPSAPLQ